MNRWVYQWHPMVMLEEMSTQRNAAATRVRARRRIRLTLGVYPQGSTQLAPLVRAAMELEKLRGLRR